MEPSLCSSFIYEETGHESLEQIEKITVPYIQMGTYTFEKLDKNFMINVQLSNFQLSYVLALDLFQFFRGVPRGEWGE